VQYEIDHQSRLVQERDEAITAVAKDFVEINAMMSDLATLVNEQDVEIAVIADNTSKGEARTGNAAKELKQAADSQAWYRRWTCYGLLCCLLLAGFVVVILKVH
jgi:t-SNARE complex subunit (syntaxin)